jgi:hypothetical protein
MFIGVGVIAAGALAVFFSNYPPRPGDSAGTIGGAQRYHSTQITGADVKVTETEVSKWMQSDTFDRIIKDPEARKLFADASIQRLFADTANNKATGTLGASGSEKLGTVSPNDTSLPGNRVPDGGPSKVGMISSESLGARLGANATERVGRLGADVNEKLGTVSPNDTSLPGNRVPDGGPSKVGMISSESLSRVGANESEKLGGKLGANTNAYLSNAMQNSAINLALHDQEFCKALANNQDLLKALTEKAQRLDSANDPK